MYVCLGNENTLDMHVCNLGSKKNTSQYIHTYIYICVCVCVCVCLGSKIPWIRMYIAKIPHKNIHMFR